MPKLYERLIIDPESALDSEKDEHIREIVDSAFDGIITINEKGIIDSFNPAASAIFGYASEEIIGKNISILTPSPHREMQDDHVRIAEGWNAIFVGEIVETRTMLQAARLHFPCYAFTNTNATHHATWSAMFPMVVNSFDRVFTSHEIGYRKPEPQAFEHVAHTLGVSLDSIMFFDDVLENVEAAAREGLHAVHVRSPADVRNALQSIGCAL